MTTDNDKPAPPALDLDAVEAAERAMTAGPWEASGCSFRHGIVQRGGNGFAHGFQDDAPCSFDVGAANAAGIVALRNAAPALIAEVRALRAAAEEREADMHARIRAGYDKTVADAWRAEVAKRDAAIAITNDVCRYLDCAASDLLAVVTSLYESRARAISDATAARGTVGGLLATAPVGSIVEFWHGATANQITTRVGGIDDRVWLWRYRNPNGEWSPWDYEAPSPDDLSQPGEIVPSDPSQRGPLPKGG